MTDSCYAYARRGGKSRSKIPVPSKKWNLQTSSIIFANAEMRKYNFLEYRARLRRVIFFFPPLFLVLTRLRRTNSPFLYFFETLARLRRANFSLPPLVVGWPTDPRPTDQPSAGRPTLGRPTDLRPAGSASSRYRHSDKTVLDWCQKGGSTN